jgi:hypothetical protein
MRRSSVGVVVVDARRMIRQPLQATAPKKKAQDRRPWAESTIEEVEETTVRIRASH